MSLRCFFPFTLLQTPQNSSENLKYLFCFQSQGVKEHIGYLNVSICCLFAWAIWHIISYLAACGNEKGLLLYSVLGNCSKPFVCFWQQTLAVKDRLQLMTFPIHGNILLKSFKYCRNRWILLDTADYCVRVNFFGPPSHGATCWNSHGNSALELFFPDIQGHVPAITDPSSGSSVCRARVARSSAHETVDPKAETRS